jgi:TolB-like protein
VKKEMPGILRHWQMRGFLIGLLICGGILNFRVDARAETKPSLAVLPFLVEKMEDPGRGAVCPICKGIYQRGEISPGSQNILTRFLYEKMEANGIFKIIPMKKLEEALSTWERKHFEEKPIPSSIQVGKELNADFMIIGSVFRFEERIGSRMGVDKPASVGFDVHLFRLKDEKMVWVGRFDETQKPLSENLFEIGSFFRRKGSWLTAEELASVGMDEMLRKLPGLKELEQ